MNISDGSHQYPGTPNKRPGGLLAQLRMVLLQPRLFFRTQRVANSQHWLSAALIILALVGASAIRQQELGGGQNTLSIGSPQSSGQRHPPKRFPTPNAQVRD